MKKFYAVRKGRKKGIFDTWDECKQNVLGFPDAVYKSFKTYEEAKNFIKFKEDENLINNEFELEAYIDGSYEDSKKLFSYACIIFFNGKKEEFSNCSNDNKLLELRNVAGELKASMYVLDFAKKNNLKNIAIYYDYAGIEKWANGEWKANLEFTKYYAKFTKDIMKDIKVHFIKIKSHTGNKYNEEVDKLAKLAIERGIL